MSGSHLGRMACTVVLVGLVWVLALAGCDTYRPQNGEGSWERHRINTIKDYVYIVELCHRTHMQDDPDLYLSRDEDPYNNWWKVSSWGDPYCDVIVFRAKKNGRMYVAVEGWDSQDDGPVDYYIRVRQRKNPARG